MESVVKTRHIHINYVCRCFTIFTNMKEVTNEFTTK